MMRSTWKRALSAILTVCMIATLLVVPAAAVPADGKYEIVFTDYTADSTTNGTGGTENYFTLTFGTGTNDKIEAKNASFTDGTNTVSFTKNFRTHGGTNSDLTRSIKFTTKNPKAKVRVFATGGSSRNIVLGKSNWGGKDDTTNVIGSVACPSDAKIYEWTIPDAGTYYIGGTNGLRFFKVEVTDKAAAAAAGESTLAFTVPEGVTVDTVTVDGEAKDFTATKETAKFFAAAGATVTFKLTAAKGYTVGSVTAGEDTLTATEGVYSVTMPAEGSTTAITITATADLNPATAVSLDATTAELKKGETKTLAATLTAQDSTKDCTDTVTWTTSNENVATVSETGVVTPVAIGITTITATANDSATATCAVAVVGADQNASPYVLEAKNMAMAADAQVTADVKYDNYFTVTNFKNVSGSSKTFSDGYKSDRRINCGGGATTSANSVKFTTGKAATVKVWWVSNKATYQMTMLDSTGNAVVGAPCAAATADNELGIATFNAPAAGTYYVGGNNNGNYIFKVEVTEIDTVAVESIALTHGYHGGDENKGRGHTIYVGGANQGTKDNFDTVTYPGTWKMEAAITPDNATEKGIIWGIPVSEDEAANYPIKVDQNGVVSANGTNLGTGTVTATAKGDTTKIAYCDVIVLPYISGVTITNGDTAETTVGVADADKVKLAATLTLEGGVQESQLSNLQKEVTWTVENGKADVLSVAADGTVTPLKAGTATVTATTKALGPEGRAEAKTDTITITVNAGTLNMAIAADNATQPASNATVTVTVTGVPDDKLANVTVTALAAGAEESAKITGTQVDQSNKWTVALPNNEDSANDVSYTITAKYTGTGDYTAADATCAVTQSKAGEKVLTVNLSTPDNKTAITEGESLVITASPKLDGTDTTDVTYQWTKDGTDITDATSATLTVTEAGSYNCTVTGVDSTDTAGLTATSQNPVVVTVNKPALESITVEQKAPVDGVTYTKGATNMLEINGNKTVAFDVTMTPADNDDTLTAALDVVNGRGLVTATYDAEAGTLTIVPNRASLDETVPRTLTLKGTKNAEAKWEVSITVKKLPAPAALAQADVTATAPTTAEGKGTITIANTQAGKTYRIKPVPTTGSADDANQDSTGWTDVTATGTTTTFNNVDPGTYMVREKVEDPNFQHISGSVTVNVPAYRNPVTNRTITFVIDSTAHLAELKVNGTAATLDNESKLVAVEGDTVTFKVTVDAGNVLDSVEGATKDANDVYTVDGTGDATVTISTVEEIVDPNKVYVKKDLADVISAARTEMKKYGAGATAADVFPGKKVVSEAVMKSLTDAMSAAIAVDNQKLNDVASITDPTDAQKANSATLKAAIDALNAKLNEFKAAAASATVDGTRTVGTAKVLTGDAMWDVAAAASANWNKSSDTRYETTAAYTEKVAGYFDVAFKSGSRVDASGAGVFADGYEGAHRINFNGGMSDTASYVGFTVAEGKTADLKVWWVSNKDNYNLALTSTDGTVTTPVGPVDPEVANVPAITSWNKLPAGTYHLGGDSGAHYLFRVEVVEKNAGATTQYTITYALAANEGTISATAPAAVTVDEGTAVTLPTAPTVDGYTFDGWYVGDTKLTGTTVTADADKTVTGKYTKNGTTPATKYGITVAAATNGTVTTTPATEAEAETEVTITATADTGYEVDAIEVKDADGAAVAVTDNKFTMPAKAVTVTVTFKAATVPGADKTALNTAITAAKAVDTTSVAVSEDGTDVPTSEKWIAKSVKDAFDKALTDAEGVADKANATQEEVDAAAKALTDATKALTDAIAAAANGTKTVTKDDLTAAIAAAKKASEDITTAEDAADVNRGTEFVTETVKTAYDAAIAKAEAVANDDAATDEQVAQALADLNTATRIFEAAKQEGTKSSGGYRPSGNGGSVNTTTDRKTETLADGTKRVTETAKDGTVTVTDTLTDGTKTVTVTTPAGESTTTVTLGRNTESVQVSIPVEDATTGMVAVIVKPDGTEEIIRDSVVVDDEVIFDLDKNATVKVVNNTKNFVDVPGHWAESDVNYVTARELFNGVSDTHFAPDSTMTRGMMATVLYRLDGENKAEKAVDFSDVTAGDWFAEAVDWAAEEGVINGYTDGSFGPDRSITREELVVMVYRYAGAPAVEGQDLEKFDDAASVANWATAAMTWAIQNGIIQGKGNNVLDPQGMASRAEVSAVLQRYVRLSK